MAVAVLNDWTGNTVAAPSGSLTISAGSDRLLWLVYIAEVSSTHTFTSITVGGQSPTGSLVEVSPDSAEQYIWSWFWDETAIAAMSGTTVAFSKSGTASKHVWDYIVFSGANAGAEYATSVTESSAANTSISTASNSSVNDFIAVAINRSSANRDVTDYDNLTEGWQYNTNFTVAVADGAGGDDTVALTGDGFSGDWFTQLLHIKASTSSPMMMKALHEGILNGQ